MLNDLTCGGHWSFLEQIFHINYFELLAVLYALQSFQAHLENRHVRVIIKLGIHIINLVLYCRCSYSPLIRFKSVLTYFH